MKEGESWKPQCPPPPRLSQNSDRLMRNGIQEEAFSLFLPPHLLLIISFSLTAEHSPFRACGSSEPPVLFIPAPAKHRLAALRLNSRFLEEIVRLVQLESDVFSCCQGVVSENVILLSREDTSHMSYI